MSNEQGETLNTEQAVPIDPSVYDFLYQDVRRVASLLAQFDSNGVLQSITRKETFAEASSSTNQYTGSLNLAALKGVAAHTDGVSENFGGESARAYDVLWKNSLSLLSYLQNHHFLERDLSSARLGQIVLVSGSLKVFDIPLLRTFFSDQGAIQQLMGIEDAKTKGEKAKQRAILKIMSSLPLPAQAELTCGDRAVWAVLNEASLESTATNLFLKYGVAMAGTWNMLGILDALPNEDTAAIEKKAEMETLTDVFASLDNMASKLGRPRTSYGITPLLVFRAVGTTASA